MTISPSTKDHDLWRGNHQSKISMALGRPNCQFTGPFESLPVGLFLVFTNRSGSNYLADLLASTERLPRCTEQFNANDVVENCRRQNWDRLDPYFAQELSRAHEGIYGAKVSVDQAAMLEDFGFFRAFKKTYWVHIRRRDLVAQAVSFHIASQTKQWSTQHERQDLIAQYDFRAILSAIRGFSSGIASAYSFFATHQLPYVEVVYEDLVAKPQAVVDDVGALVGRDLGGIQQRRLTLGRQSDELNAEFKAQFLKDFRGR